LFLAVVGMRIQTQVNVSEQVLALQHGEDRNIADQASSMTIRTNAGAWSSYMPPPAPHSRDDRPFAWTLSFFCRVHVSLGLSRSSGSSSTLLSCWPCPLLLAGPLRVGSFMPKLPHDTTPLGSIATAVAGPSISPQTYTRLSALMVTTVFFA